MRVAIIGGGIIGLYTGLNLVKRGFDVEIFEEDLVIGEPQHCTGVVSEFVALKLGKLIGKDVIQNSIKTLYILIPPYLELELKAKKRVFILDRKIVERRLANLIMSYGGLIHTGVNVVYARNGRLLSGKGKISARNKYDIIINAGGIKTAIKRVSLRDRLLPAYQVDIKTNFFNENMIKITVDKKLNPLFFIWQVPVKEDDKIIRVGTASSRFPKYLISKFIRTNNIRGKIINKYSGFIVVTGPIKPFYKNGIIYVGDAAGQTKLTTGGGIAYGLSASDILCNILLNNENINKYEKIWLKRWAFEILLQKLARKVFLLSDQKEIALIINYLNKKGVLHSLVDEGDVDAHMSSLLKILTKIPRFV